MVYSQTISSSSMASHAPHSPNITRTLTLYWATPLPERDRYSLIETSKHNASLIKYLGSSPVRSSIRSPRRPPVDRQLIRELIKSVPIILVDSNLVSSPRETTPG